MHHSGKLDEAGRLYEAILRTGNRNFDALHQFGILHYQTGRYDKACELLERALAQNANSAPAWCNKGLVLQAQGRPLALPVAHFHAMLWQCALDALVALVALQIFPQLGSARAHRR